MKRHFIKKYIFTILFMFCLFAYAGINFAAEIPTVYETIEGLDWKNVSGSVSELENVINDNVYQKYAWIETFGAVEKILGMDVDNGFSYVKSTEGSLNYTAEQADSSIFRQNAAIINEINTLALTYGAEPIVLLAPDKYIAGEAEYREGIPYWDRNEELDIVRKETEKQGVSCIDTRDYIEEIWEWSKEPIFFNTDHHWRIKPGFYMAGILMDKMGETWDEELNPNGFYSNLDNYNVYTYENCFLGSIGRKTGAVYAGLDDIDLIYPKYETDFVHRYKSKADSDEVVTEGEFVRSILDIYNLNNTDSIYVSDKYSIYLDSVNAEDYITNRIKEEGPRVLIIRDSFMAPAASFLAPVCSELDMVWSMRYTGDLEQLMSEGNYDYVVVELGSSNLYSEELFRFLKK